MQTLMEFAIARITPTSDQKSALETINGFLASPDRCFMLKGYAGTGKTFLTKVLVEYLDDNNIPVKLMAPTGRAARILSDKAKAKATTIHKAIYNILDLDEIELKQKGKVKYKFRYNLQKNTKCRDGVIIVDEASMVSNRYNEHDFFIFGTGFLLKDLVEYAGINDSDSKSKLIFIGDPAQLPPVGDSISGALSEPYFTRNFGIEPKVYELTEVVRQQQESGVLKLASSIRKMLTEKVRNTFIVEDGPDIEKIDVKEVAELYLEQNPDLSPADAAIINYSNSASLEFNMAVRETRFSDKYHLKANDLLMIVQNNYNYHIELFNGTLAKVLEVSDQPEIKAGMLSYNADGEECRITCQFRKVLIEVPDADNEMEALPCLILEDFLYSPKPSPDYAQNVALYLDFKIRHPHLKPGTKAFTDTLRADRYFNALKVKYGYAITCHKAQGGEWDKVFLNLDIPASRLSDSYLRWIYTAVTRARKSLYVFNVTMKNQFSGFTYEHQLNAETMGQMTDETGSILVESLDGYEELVRQFGLGGQLKFRLDKLLELWAVCRERGIVITEHRTETYADIYRFVQNDQSSGLKFYFNGKGQYTKIERFIPWIKSTALTEELISILAKPSKIRLQTRTTPSSEIGRLAFGESDAYPDPESYFNEDQQELKILWQEIAEALENKQIEIEDIQHRQYMENYFFSRGEEKAMIQFWYNKNFVFTTGKPRLDLSNSNKLLNDLHGILNQLTIS